MYYMYVWICVVLYGRVPSTHLCVYSIAHFNNGTQKCKKTNQKTKRTLVVWWSGMLSDPETPQAWGSCSDCDSHNGMPWLLVCKREPVSFPHWPGSDVAPMVKIRLRDVSIWSSIVLRSSDSSNVGKSNHGGFWCWGLVLAAWTSSQFTSHGASHGLWKSETKTSQVKQLGCLIWPESSGLCPFLNFRSSYIHPKVRISYLYQTIANTIGCFPCWFQHLPTDEGIIWRYEEIAELHWPQPDQPGPWSRRVPHCTGSVPSAFFFTLLLLDRVSYQQYIKLCVHPTWVHTVHKMIVCKLCGHIP